MVLMLIMQMDQMVLMIVVMIVDMIMTLSSLELIKRSLLQRLPQVAFTCAA